LLRLTTTAKVAVCVFRWCRGPNSSLVCGRAWSGSRALA